MWKNRLIYLAALLGFFIFYACYSNGLSAYTMLFLLLLPLFSLACSLPALLTCRLVADAPGLCRRNDEAVYKLSLVCGLKMIPPLCSLVLRCRYSTGKEDRVDRLSLAGGAVKHYLIPTEHCGSVEFTVENSRCYDFLGLFSFSVGFDGIHRKKSSEETITRILIAPLPIKPEPCPDLAALSRSTFRPKPGGGYAEAVEFREYVPGDSVREINWKLSAKTDKTIVREAQIPVATPICVCAEFSRGPSEQDRIWDNTLWLCRHFLEKEQSIYLCYGDAERQSTELLSIPDEDALRDAFYRMLRIREPWKGRLVYGNLPSGLRLVRLSEGGEELT